MSQSRPPPQSLGKPHEGIEPEEMAARIAKRRGQALRRGGRRLKLWLVSLIMKGIRRILKSPHFKESGEEILKGLQDSLSEGQMRSKEWLISSLKKTQKTDLGNVYVLAGWYGVLPFLLLRDKEIKCKRI